MPRHTTWDDLDADVLGEVLDNPAVRLGEYIMNLRVSELFFAMACLLSMVLFVYAPHPPKQISQRLIDSMYGAPSPPSASQSRRTTWGTDATAFAASAVDSLSHIYANTA
mmetsp:Transcript_42953/g.63209  ORF Transcript_42953/g.63209 Transcript_42953/m.63209 type:complete len:110 (+) Transcript_42953:279-608(+)|eukprot:CAMPEP_0179430426 /NCGR_PEP_ID=MMETSP0799-20121207/15573_1 /TAXON_ID=46947 /ORGANISM="Geminigera cryophila, Strain CCMP2564" /LENGTH=109 /DNA_ID=CAMNT_0021206859 /DNA_START=249 /DNA_END=578 /DNA_ORIENTATION=-